jgi:hypothetical protein
MLELPRDLVHRKHSFGSLVERPGALQQSLRRGALEGSLWRPPNAGLQRTVHSVTEREQLAFRKRSPPNVCNWPLASLPSASGAATRLSRPAFVALLFPWLCHPVFWRKRLLLRRQPRTQPALEVLAALLLRLHG